MSGIGREEKELNERYLEQNFSNSRRESTASTSESTSNLNWLPQSFGRYKSVWACLLTGSVCTAGSVAIGTYAFRNFEHPARWAVVCGSAGAVGLYLVGRSFIQVRLVNPFKQPTINDLMEVEARRCADLLARLDVSPWLKGQSAASFPPSPAVSDLSSDILTVARADYRPQSSDLSFRQKQEDRAQKYKKFVQKEWISAPNVMVNIAPNATVDEASKEREEGKEKAV